MISARPLFNLPTPVLRHDQEPTSSACGLAGQRPELPRALQTISTHRNPPTPVLRYSEEPDRTAADARSPRRLPRSRSRGFSFTEILFAVIILGIGFIMIAAIFPVAIQQGKVTTEEGTATGVAREALNYLGQIGANSDNDSAYIAPGVNPGPLFPATGFVGGTAPYLGMVYSMRDPQPWVAGAQNPNTYAVPASPVTNTLLQSVTASTGNLWNRLNLSLIVPSDQRYAFVGLYRRNGNPLDRRTWSPFAQVWFIPVTARARSVFNAGTLGSPGVDINAASSPPQLNLQSRLVKVRITDPNGLFSTTGTGGYVLLNYATAPAGYTPTALSENCFVIIANDESAPTTLDGIPNPDIGRMNGHIYHVGLRRPDLDGSDTTGSYTAYDLAPNGDFSPDPGADGFFGTNPNAAANVPPLTSDDDILAIGNIKAQPAGASQIYASGPADAYVVGVDNTTADPGSSQDISAFTTFIKVN